MRGGLREGFSDVSAELGSGVRPVKSCGNSKPEEWQVQRL